MSNDPYNPPQSNLDVAANGKISPAIWNPGAAASWSLLFSPVFGALVQMKNWQALGEPEAAERSKLWAIGCGVGLFVLILLGVIMPGSKGIDVLGRIGGFGMLIAWYFSNAKDQMRFVANGYGKDYERRGWGMPLLYGVLGLIAIVVVAIVVAMVLGVAPEAE